MGFFQQLKLNKYGKGLRYSLVPREIVFVGRTTKDNDLEWKYSSESGINGNAIQSFRTV